MWTLANPLVKLGLGLLLVLGVFAGGVFFEYSHTYLPYKAEVQATAKVQAAQIALINKTNKEASIEAEQTATADIKGVYDWYAAHPTIKWVRQPSSSQASGTTSNTQESGTVPTNGYEPSFTPKQCSLVAIQLEDLLNLLHKSPTIKFEQ